MLIVGSYSEFWEKQVRPFLIHFFFRDELINPLIQINHPIRTQSQVSQEKSIISLKDANSELQKIYQEYSIKEKNFLGKYKDFKKSANFTINYMELICDFFEKSKNLIRWEEKRMTQYFFLLLLVLFFIVSFLPLRFLIILFLTYKFYKGRLYHKRRVRNN